MRKDDAVPKLTGIWQAVLGIEAILPDQNYFDLGGDSSLAVHIFAQIEKVFGVKLPLATLYEAPTVRELAALLVRERSAGDWSPLVAIQPSGSRPTFFCVHGAGGNVLIYRELSRALGPDQPFFGLQSKGLDGSCAPLETIDEMAALYADEIQRVQPQGPYYLGGYCSGGTIAYEIAQQLRRRREAVALLALFDTMNWAHVFPVSWWTLSYHSLERLAFHCANFFALDSANRSKFIASKFAVLRSRIPVWKGAVLSKLGGRSERGAEAVALSRVWRANDAAMAKYVPQPYAGVVTDFRPTRQYRAFRKPNVKWEKLAEEQEVVVLPVYPAGMLVEPFVHHLARALEQAIDRAGERQKRPEAALQSR